MTIPSLHLFFDRFKSTDKNALFRFDFDHQLNQELLLKPAEKVLNISVNITEDTFPENNETFLLTLIASDEVSTITGGSVTITILNNGESDTKYDLWKI